MWQCGAYLSSSKLEKKAERVVSESCYLWCKEYIQLYVLWRSLGAGHPQNHSMSGEECLRVGIIELMAVVALNNFDGVTKLCGDKSKKLTRWKRCQI
jgi:hypothetical protein